MTGMDDNWGRDLFRGRTRWWQVSRIRMAKGKVSRSKRGKQGLWCSYKVWDKLTYPTLSIVVPCNRCESNSDKGWCSILFSKRERICSQRTSLAKIPETIILIKPENEKAKIVGQRNTINSLSPVPRLWARTRRKLVRDRTKTLCGKVQPIQMLEAFSSAAESDQVRLGESHLSASREGCQ